MAYIGPQDRVLETTTSTGTGEIALAAAITGFRRFNAVCAVGDTLSYFIEAIDSVGLPTGDYEYGIGTYSAANTLTRTTVLGSSNGGAAVNFAAGSKNVGITLQRYDLVNWGAQIAPAGTVLQEVVLTDAGASTTSNVLTNVTASTKNITPKSANSTIVIDVAFNGLVLAAGAGLNSTGGFRLFNSTAAADIGIEQTLGTVSAGGANLQSQAPCVIRATLANAALTTIGFLLRARYSTASAQVAANSQVWTIREIKA